ncbi:hypothetical protein P171DRAFT_82742 [Karstenula rhodostoma CBS 690.94]|uniref:Uncharacterized protein n=1 Tax=Karstenula rhodostoma CBS 690.94 TaxID=1392251 RepID=A0A9P4U850_9PLEO|nr:hypothetical protein P171DRAFT_82742 [Karstenula rhodostoma CBS 690.94]
MIGVPLPYCRVYTSTRAALVVVVAISGFDTSSYCYHFHVRPRRLGRYQLLMLVLHKSLSFVRAISHCPSLVPKKRAGTRVGLHSSIYFGESAHLRCGGRCSLAGASGVLF